MTQRFSIHPDNPQRRLVQQSVEILRRDGLIVYPTDSCYAFGWHLGDHESAGRVQRIRGTGKDHNFTVMCRDLSEIATYAKVENWCYRLLRAHTPGPYTFILKATREIPRRLQNPRRQTIGIRVPAHPVPLALLEALGEPMMSSTLLLPGQALPLSDPEEIACSLAGSVDLLIDSGSCGVEPTTVVDVTGDYPRVIRQGRGDSSAFV
jgi:tRNA threonylcarbamoyl adenosine modification protein (Sua5/YciO/YrdC/YwlC family)